MGYSAVKLKFEILRSLDTSTLSGSYVRIGGALQFEARLLKLVNASNVNLLISTDGVNDMDIVPADNYVLYDAGANRGSSAPSMIFAKGTQFFLKSTAGTGVAYLTVLYGDSPDLTIPGM